MKKRVVLSMLAGMLLLQSIPVSAQEVGRVALQSTTAEVPTAFSADSKPSDLSQIVVTLPARMDLSLDESKEHFTNSSQISAKGTLKNTYRLSVSTSDSVTYESETAPDVTGTVSFGNQKWTAAQLEASKTTLDSRDISITVNNDENIQQCSYSGVLSFNIAVELDDGSTGGSGTGDLSGATAYTLNNSDIALCTIDGDTLTIPRSFEKDGVLYKVTAIGNNAFYDTETYNSIIPSTVTKVVIPDTVTSIGDYAFNDCVRLTTINIPDGVTSIGEGAFYYCTSLTSIDIPDSVTNIGGMVFSCCSSLTTINIPDGVTSIGAEAFSGCSSLTTINIPDSVTNIGFMAFSCCSRLTTINIPDGVTSIGSYVFESCSSLTSVTIPASVTSIGEEAFVGCTNLSTINYSGTQSQFQSISIDTYSGLSGKTIHCTDGDLTL